MSVVEGIERKAELSKYLDNTESKMTSKFAALNLSQNIKYASKFGG